MDAKEIKKRLDDEIASDKEFYNYHGIRKENIADFLVMPVEIEVKDAKTMEKSLMWLVLNECKFRGGYSIALAPQDMTWALLDQNEREEYISHSHHRALADALSEM